MSHEIRPATAADAPFLAEIVQLATRSHVETGVFDLAIQSCEEDRLRAIEAILTTDVPSWCHYSNFVIAEVEGRPAAALSGYSAYDDSLYPMDKTFLTGFEVLGFSADEIASAWIRMAVLMKCHSEDEQGAWIIEWVGCRAEYRRRGLVDALLREKLAHGTQRGHDFAQIGILMGNTPAQRAYENAGFELHYEKTHPDFEAAIGCPGMARLLVEYR